LSSDLLVFKAKDYIPTIVGENKDKIVEVKFDHAFSQLMVTFNQLAAFVSPRRYQMLLPVASPKQPPCKTSASVYRVPESTLHLCNIIM
jgi:hypothetical protein